MPDAPATIAQLFAKDPFDYTKEDIDRIIEYYRARRKDFNLTGKAQPRVEKKPINLDELGL